MQSILNERTGVVEMEKGGSKNIDDSRCRICLSDSTNLTSIFSLHIGGKPNIGGKLTISKMLTSFCSFQLTKEDDFFDQVCEKCSRETVRAYNFKLKCEKSYELLLRQAKEINTEMDHEFFPLETIGTDYVDLDCATVEVKTVDARVGLLHAESPYQETKTNDDPTGFGEMESFETSNIAGHQSKVEITLLPTEKLTNFIKSVHTYALTRPIQYNCSKCSFTSKFESRLKTHIKFLHSGKKNSSSCKFQARVKKLIVQHSGEKRFKCDKCNFSTSYKHSLLEHVRKHSTERSFQCKICGVFLRYMRGLRGHMKIHSEKKPYACNECSYTSAQKGSLNTHIMAKHTYNGEKPFQCDKCSYSSSSERYLRNHKLKHTGMKLYRGVKCDYLSTIENNLTTHSLEYLGNKRLKNKHLGNKCLGNKHLGNERFLCYLCGKSFSAKFSLETHIRTHTGEKPYSCCFCSFSTNNKDYLKIHERIHSGEKPFTCDECSRSFKLRKRLQAHKLTHSGVRAFSCDKCDKTFALKGTLKAHMYTHTGEKPFACDQCNYSTSHKTRLKYHLLSHSARKPFSCEKCNFSCTRNSALKTHMLSHANAC